jgi:hypothetical protein
MSQTLPIDRPWSPDLDWDTTAGRALSALIAGLQGAGGEWLVNVFGSAPLQMAYARDFISNDVDTSVIWQKEPEFERVIHENRLGRDQAELYIQSCKEAAFRTSPKWKDRAFRDIRGLITLRFAHPIDILLGKLNRLEEKDFKAFELVRSATGEPTEQTLLRELREAPDLFSHAYIAPRGTASYAQNTARFWHLFYQKDIDIEREIIVPANEALRRNYDIGGNYKADLRAISQSRPEPMVLPQSKPPSDGPS